MGRVLYFDCYAGISGDMTVGALLDLGVDPEELLAQLRKLNLEGWFVQVGRGQKNGISGTKFDVILDHPGETGQQHEMPHQHRNLYDIELIIDHSTLSDQIKASSKNIFAELARAEAKIHARPIEAVHFHEVGALDSIIDIVGTAICLDLLGVEAIYASPVNLGGGLVNCAHGTLPVPAPATLEILQGVPVYSSGIQAELVTPTGAAILKVLACDFIPLPSLTVEQTGYGMGTRDLMEMPNLLRAILGYRKATGEYLLLETNIDDMNPELYSYLLPLLLENGALDVYLASIMMKKNRPGTLVSVLCKSSDAHRLQAILFAETTTLGIRRLQVEREELERRLENIDTSLGTVRVKVAYREGKILKYAPEYEDCRRIAAKKGLPLRAVYDIVNREVAESRNTGRTF